MSEFKKIVITSEQYVGVFGQVRIALIGELGAMYDDELGDSSNPDYIGERQLAQMVKSVVDSVFCTVSSPTGEPIISKAVRP